MKNKIDKLMESLKYEKSMGLMTHIVTGYPTLKFSKKIAKTLVMSGADIIEIQIPFSDPMADGPLIVEACQKSLESGTRVMDSFKLAKYINIRLKTPVVIMTYANIVIRMGIDKFCRTCKKYGVSGLIVPDLPFDSEECRKLKFYLKKLNIHFIYVISPAIEDDRLKEIQKLASGFLYCTSRQGTTGKGKNFSKNINLYLSRVKKDFTFPLAVGFGISSLQDLDLIKKYAQICIIGSAIINIVKKNKTPKILSQISKFISKLKK